jgi:hypothetical protein
MAAQEYGWPIWQLDSILNLAILAVQGRHLAGVWPKWQFIPMFSFFLFCQNGCSVPPYYGAHYARNGVS